MADSWVREMTMRAFFELFMHVDSVQPAHFDEKHTFKLNITPTTKEKDIYKAIMAGLKDFFTNFEMICLSEVPDPLTGRKPDLQLVHKSKEQELKFIIQTPDALDENAHRPSTMGKSDMPVEIKTEQDSFKFPLGSGAQFIRGQLIAYATNILALQHRTHVFAIGIFGSVARFFRFDRAGAFMSEQVDYIKDRSTFLEFFRRYDLLSAKDRGYDTTVLPTNLAEQSLFHNKLLEFREKVRNGGRASPAVEQTLDMWQWYDTVKVSVPNCSPTSSSMSSGPSSTNSNESSISSEAPSASSGPSPTSSGPSSKPSDPSSSKSSPPSSNTYIFSAPFFHPASITGRATKCFVAYCVEMDKLVCLKDTWRSVHPHSQPEHIAIQEICTAYEKTRKYLPVVYSAGDVMVDGETQVTLTDKWNSLKGAEWVNNQAQAAKNMKAYIHYRITEELLYPLSTVKNSYELCVVTYDINFVLLLVWKHCGKYLHRDVSSGNVMTDENGRGKLADWDHSRQMSRPVDESESCQKFRTGTWQFLSVRLIQNPCEPHHVIDDLESLFWVFINTGLRYCHIKIPNFDFSGLFDHDDGVGKMKFLQGNVPHLFELEPLQALFKSYRSIFKSIHTKRGVFLYLNDELSELTSDPVGAKPEDIPEQAHQELASNVFEHDDGEDSSAAKQDSSEIKALSGNSEHQRRRAAVKAAEMDYVNAVEAISTPSQNEILDLLMTTGLSLTRYEDSKHYGTMPCQFSNTKRPKANQGPGTVPMQSSHLPIPSLSLSLQAQPAIPDPEKASTSRQSGSSLGKRSIAEIDEYHPVTHRFKKKKLDEAEVTTEEDAPQASASAPQASTSAPRASMSASTPSTRGNRRSTRNRPSTASLRGPSPQRTRGRARKSKRGLSLN
ncbi:hypothetical protein C8Q75DRAFT_772309 [Abortiporus biennis]|nr:hypothetical protein C8Q75DRAFT_772309 [Abortiporus biennis]